jgi:AhpD family alkylhydroperoxidase
VTERMNDLAASPRGMQAFGGVHLYIERSGLPSPLVNPVYLRVSQINGCAYCIATHSTDLMKQGVAVQKLLLLQVWRESGAMFSDRERAALQGAEALAHVAQTHVPDADYQAARGQSDDKELADLTYAIALINAYNRIAIGFGRGPDASFTDAASQCGRRVPVFNLCALRLLSPRLA